MLEQRPFEDLENGLVDPPLNPWRPAARQGCWNALEGGTPGTEGPPCIKECASIGGRSGLETEILTRSGVFPGFSGLVCC